VDTVRLKGGKMLFFSLLLIALAYSGNASGQGEVTSALILTTTGKQAEGSLTGILPTVRLDASSLTDYVGPAQAFDIPRARIRQITLDFPRMVVETDDRVYVGPFSAFTGISELLVLHHGQETLRLETSSVRAIALHGHPLHPVPREWLGSTFLVMPLATAASPLVTATGEAPRAPSEPIVSPTGEELYPEVPIESEQEGPWWLGLLIVAALIALVYFSLSAVGG